MNRPEHLARPPFTIVPALDPAEVATEIVACFERVACRADRVQYAHALAMRSIGLDPDDALYRAGRAIAADIDRGVGAGVASGYHNARHYLEVALFALYLSRMQQLPRDRAARVVTAAMIHDFHHDGSRSADAPFKLEVISAASAEPYFASAGVAPELRRQLRALVLATEPHAGVSFARDCLEHQRKGARAPSGAGIPEALAQLANEPELALEAVLLAEADVLPSIGLTATHGQYVQDRLAAEWNVTLGPGDKLGFIDLVRDSITIGSFFAPNIAALRQVFLEQSRAGA